MVTLLIADDEADMRILIRVSLDMEVSDVTVLGEAADGAEALALWRGLCPKPELVILDDRMPGLSGIEVAARLLAERPDLPIILFSAFIDDATRSAATRVGIRRCIGKRNLDELATAVRSLSAA